MSSRNKVIPVVLRPSLRVVDIVARLDDDARAHRPAFDRSFTVVVPDLVDAMHSGLFNRKIHLFELSSKCADIRGARRG